MCENGNIHSLFFTDFEYINQNVLNMRFNTCWGRQKKVKFLDVIIKFRDHEMVTMCCHKPIAGNSLLHFNSCHLII